MQDHQKRGRLPRYLVLGLAIAAIVVPVAQADVRTLADYPSSLAREAASSYGPLPEAPTKTLADYPRVLAREAAGSYGPLPEAPTKTLADYPRVLAREAAGSYGPLPDTPSGVVSQPQGFGRRVSAIDATTVLTLVLVGAAALVSTRQKSRNRRSSP
jgi:hypothetical protein